MATDTTCQSLVSIQNFLQGIQKELSKYKEGLQKDIAVLTSMSEYKEEVAAKRQRLAQLLEYESLLFGNEKRLFRSFQQDTDGVYSRYPQAIHEYIRTNNKSNLRSMILSPKEEDSVLRTISPLFTLRRNISAGNSTFDDIRAETRHRFAEDLQTFLCTLEKLPDPPIDESTKETADDAGETLYQKILEDTMQRLEEKPITVQRVIEGLSAYPFIQTERAFSGITETETKSRHEVLLDMFGYAPEDLSDDEEIKNLVRLFLDANKDFISIQKVDVPGTKSTLFYYTPEEHEAKEASLPKMQERMSIMTQFMLGIINMYCDLNHLSHINFGNVLDESRALSHGLAEKVYSGFIDGDNIEAIILSFINENHPAFSLTEPLSEEAQKAIVADFHVRFSQIDGSPHYDEFFLLYHDFPGLFKTYSGFIGMDFAHLASTTKGIELSPSSALLPVAEQAIHLPTEPSAKREDAISSIELTKEAFEKASKLPYDFFVGLSPEMQTLMMNHPELLSLSIEKIKLTPESINTYGKDKLLDIYETYQKAMEIPHYQSEFLRFDDTVSSNQRITFIYSQNIEHADILADSNIYASLQKLESDPIKLGKIIQVANLYTLSNFIKSLDDMQEDEFKILQQLFQSSANSGYQDRYHAELACNLAWTTWSSAKLTLLDLKYKPFVELALEPAFFRTKPDFAAKLLNPQTYLLLNNKSIDLLLPNQKINILRQSLSDDTLRKNMVNLLRAFPDNFIRNQTQEPLITSADLAIHQNHLGFLPIFQNMPDTFSSEYMKNLIAITSLTDFFMNHYNEQDREKCIASIFGSQPTIARFAYSHANVLNQMLRTILKDFIASATEEKVTALEQQYAGNPDPEALKEAIFKIAYPQCTATYSTISNLNNVVKNLGLLLLYTIDDWKDLPIDWNEEVESLKNLDSFQSDTISKLQPTDVINILQPDWKDFIKNKDISFKEILLTALSDEEKREPYGTFAKQKFNCLEQAYRMDVPTRHWMLFDDVGRNHIEKTCNEHLDLAGPLLELIKHQDFKEIYANLEMVCRQSSEFIPRSNALLILVKAHHALGITKGLAWITEVLSREDALQTLVKVALLSNSPSILNKIKEEGVEDIDALLTMPEVNDIYEKITLCVAQKEIFNDAVQDGFFEKILPFLDSSIEALPSFLPNLFSKEEALYAFYTICDACKYDPNKELEILNTQSPETIHKVMSNALFFKDQLANHDNAYVILSSDTSKEHFFEHLCSITDDEEITDQLRKITLATFSIAVIQPLSYAELRKIFEPSFLHQLLTNDLPEFLDDLSHGNFDTTNTFPHRQLIASLQILRQHPQYANFLDTLTSRINVTPQTILDADWEYLLKHYPDHTPLKILEKFKDALSNHIDIEFKNIPPEIKHYRHLLLPLNDLEDINAIVNINSESIHSLNILVTQLGIKFTDPFFHQSNQRNFDKIIGHYKFILDDTAFLQTLNLPADALLSAISRSPSSHQLKELEEFLKENAILTDYVRKIVDTLYAPDYQACDLSTLTYFIKLIGTNPKTLDRIQTLHQEWMKALRDHDALPLSVTNTLNELLVTDAMRTIHPNLITHRPSEGGAYFNVIAGISIIALAIIGDEASPIQAASHYHQRLTTMHEHLGRELFEWIFTYGKSVAEELGNESNSAQSTQFERFTNIISRACEDNKYDNLRTLKEILTDESLAPKHNELESSIFDIKDEYYHLDAINNLINFFKLMDRDFKQEYLQLSPDNFEAFIQAVLHIPEDAPPEELERDKGKIQAELAANPGMTLAQATINATGNNAESHMAPNEPPTSPRQRM